MILCTMSWIRRSLESKKVIQTPITYEIEEEGDETDSNFSDEMVRPSNYLGLARFQLDLVLAGVEVKTFVANFQRSTTTTLIHSAILT